MVNRSLLVGWWLWLVDVGRAHLLLYCSKVARTGFSTIFHTTDFRSFVQTIYVKPRGNGSTHRRLFLNRSSWCTRLTGEKLHASLSQSWLCFWCFRPKKRCVTPIARLTDRQFRRNRMGNVPRTHMPAAVSRHASRPSCCTGRGGMSFLPF